MATIFYRTIMATTFYSSIMATICYSSVIDNSYCWYYQWYKSFHRQKTRDRRGLLPSTPPLWMLYFYHLLLLGVYGGICYYWEYMGVCDSSGYLCIKCDSSGGYLFFLKIFCRVKQSRTIKDKKQITMGEGYARNSTRGYAHEHNITTGYASEDNITTILFLKCTDGGGCGHGVGYCLLSLVFQMIYVLFNSYFLSIYFFNRKLF